MTIIFAPIGIPGCGKSTFINRLVKAGKFPASSVISTDEIRLALCGNLSDQSRNGEVFAYAEEAIVATLLSGRDAYYDATNLTAGSRNRILHLAEQVPGTDVAWIDFDVPFDVCCERNAARPQPVPDDVMNRMLLLHSAVEWSDLARSGVICTPTAATELMEGSRFDTSSKAGS
jgi:predicted kinase